MVPVRPPTTIVDGCDGWDNDSDGLLDEDHAPALCYADNCPGVTLCHFGSSVCVAVDCTPPPLCEKPVDIVVIMDRSSSMRPMTTQLTARLSTLAQQTPGAAWWVINVPDGDNGEISFRMHPDCHQDSPPHAPCESTEFLSAMAEISMFWLGGYEPQITALSAVTSESLIAWRPGAEKHVWIFSDEHPQGAPGLADTLQRAADAAIEVDVWTNSEAWPVGEYRHTLGQEIEGLCE